MDIKNKNIIGILFCYVYILEWFNVFVVAACLKNK